LIPADARLVSGQGIVDYSFVTGESEPVTRKPGDYLYAGGQQTGGAIEVEVVKPVSQSYLTSLWSHAAFAKERTQTLNTLTNRLSRWFVAAVVLVATGTVGYWLANDPSLAGRAFTAVLIVACPCALALAAPFALGTGQRWLARRNIFLKNPQVLETLARVDMIVFDKTGTLTEARRGGVSFVGEPLSEAESMQVRELARHSTHPLARQIGEWLRAAWGGSKDVAATRQSAAISASECLWRSSETPLRDEPSEESVGGFREHSGRGIEGRVAGHELWLGSAVWLESRGASVPEAAAGGSSVVHLAVDGVYRGHFKVGSTLRPQTESLIGELSTRRELALLSGDNERERETFRALFGERAKLRFNESPLGKLDFIRDLQQGRRTVMMVGDGLNDAGALRQSDVGVAVVEKVGAFSPASDVILEASLVPRLPALLRFSRLCVGVVYASFALSVIYNTVGITLAVRGLFSPLVSAILMPVSSVTVVAFACGATTWAARRAGLLEEQAAPEV
jgi:Cu+-exporting ATPase